MTEPHAPHDCGTCCEARGCEPDMFAVTHEPLEALTAICGTCGGSEPGGVVPGVGCVAVRELPVHPQRCGAAGPSGG